jgi:hypothetical protein
MLLGLKQTITYWAPTGETQFGGKTFAAPVAIKGRWEDKLENIVDSFGREYVTKSRVYTSQALELTGYIYLGTSVAADPRGVEGAAEVRTVTSVPSISALRKLYVNFV